MKHITFYQWLLNCEANTQFQPGEICMECSGRGFVDWIEFGTIEDHEQGLNAFDCPECGDFEKLETLEAEYLKCRQKDSQAAGQQVNHEQQRIDDLPLFEER